MEAQKSAQCQFLVPPPLSQMELCRFKGQNQGLTQGQEEMTTTQMPEVAEVKQK